MFDVIKSIRTSVTLSVTGPYVEKIINMASLSSFGISDVERLGCDSVRLTVAVDDYRKIRDFCRKNGYKTKIVQKRGLVFKTKALRGRYGLLAGAAFFVFVLYILTSRIWTMSLTSDNADEGYIYDIAREYGIEVGARKKDLDIRQINLDIIKKYHELIYFNVNFYGCHAEIVVKQRGRDIEVVDESLPCDIVSDKDGIVDRILVGDGTAAVAENQTVLKGDTLILGEITYDYGEDKRTVDVHASGEVTLKTWKRLHWCIPKDLTVGEKTGRETKRYTLIVGKQGFPLYFLEKNPYVCYDKRYKVSYFTLFEGARLPLGLACESFAELEPKKAEYQADGERLCNEMRESLLSKDVDVVSGSFSKTEKGAFILAEYEAECLEKAGVEKVR